MGLCYFAWKCMTCVASFCSYYQFDNGMNICAVTGTIQGADFEVGPSNAESCIPRTTAEPITTTEVPSTSYTTSATSQPAFTPLFTTTVEPVMPAKVSEAWMYGFIGLACTVILITVGIITYCLGKFRTFRQLQERLRRRGAREQTFPLRISSLPDAFD